VSWKDYDGTANKSVIGRFLGLGAKYQNSNGTERDISVHAYENGSPKLVVIEGFLNPRVFFFEEADVADILAQAVNQEKISQRLPPFATPL